MSNAPEDMIVDSEDTPSEFVDRTGKRVLGSPELGEYEDKESVLLHSSGRPVTD